MFENHVCAWCSQRDPAYQKESFLRPLTPLTCCGCTSKPVLASTLSVPTHKYLYISKSPAPIPTPPNPSYTPSLSPLFLPLSHFPSPSHGWSTLCSELFQTPLAVLTSVIKTLSTAWSSGVYSLLAVPPCTSLYGFQKLNSGHQSWWHASLPIEPSY